MHTPDPDILEWAAREGRQLITRDRTTMTPHAYERVAHGLPMPGVFVIPEEMSVGPAVEELELIALASESDDWRDRVIFFPFANLWHPIQRLQQPIDLPRRIVMHQPERAAGTRLVPGRVERDDHGDRAHRLVALAR